MEEMTMKDLTPEIMKGLEGLKTTQEMKEYCRNEGYDLTDELAERIAAQFGKSGELSDEEAANAAGGEAIEGPDMYIRHFHYTC